MTVNIYFQTIEHGGTGDKFSMERPKNSTERPKNLLTNGCKSKVHGLSHLVAGVLASWLKLNGSKTIGLAFGLDWLTTRLMSNKQHEIQFLHGILYLAIYRRRQQKRTNKQTTVTETTEKSAFTASSPTFPHNTNTSGSPR